MEFRLLALVDHLGYGPDSIHGVGRYLRNVLPSLAQRGIAIKLAILGDRDRLADYPACRPVERLSLRHHRYDPRTPAVILREFRNFSPMLVYSTQFRASVLARAIAGFHRVPSLVHLHDLSPVPWPCRAVLSTLPSQTAHALAVSNAVAEAMPGQYAVPTGHVQTLLNPLDPVFLEASTDQHAGRAVRDQLGIPVDASVGLIVGRLHAVKGHEDLIHSLPRLLRRVPNFRLLVAGDGPEQPRCVRLAVELGVARQVHWLGFRTDMDRLYAASDVVLVPSRSEGLPYVALEAAAAGRAVVAFDVGGIRDAVIPDCSGVLVPPGAYASFIEATAHVLETPELRHRLARGGRALATRFELNAHADWLSQHMRGLAYGRDQSGIVPTQHRGRAA